MKVDLSKLSAEHYLAHRKVRIIAEYWFSLAVKRIDRIDALTLKTWAEILDRAIKGEREATGMKYEDINKAIELLSKYNYQIIDRLSENKEALDIDDLELD